MSRTLTPKDAASIMNALFKEATGQTASLTAEDISGFISAGEQVLATGIENTLNKLSMVCIRSMAKVRPYKAKYNLIDASSEELFTSRLRMIFYKTSDVLNAGDWNTDLYTNLANGYDNGSNSGASTASMWEQHKKIPVEINFSGVSVYQACLTHFQNQLNQAFRSPAELANYLNAEFLDFANDLEQVKERFNMAVVLNRLAASIYYEQNSSTVTSYGLETCAIDMTAAFNAEYGTSYTTAQIKSSHMTEFAKFLAETIKNLSDKFTDRTGLYHCRYPDLDSSTSAELNMVAAHTPKANQKLFMYQPLMNKIAAEVMPSIFNPQYLSIENYEGVNFWQNINHPNEISVKPALPDLNGSGQTAASSAVSADVIGMIFDTDALMTSFIHEGSESTPLEARKRYYNVWTSIARNNIDCYAKQAVVLYFGKDPEPEPEGGAGGDAGGAVG